MCFPAVPEFHALVGNEAAEELLSSMGDAVCSSLALKKCFTRMMNCEKKVFVDQLNMLVKRVTEEGTVPNLQGLYQHYPVCQPFILYCWICNKRIVHPHLEFSVKPVSTLVSDYMVAARYRC